MCILVCPRARTHTCTHMHTKMSSKILDNSSSSGPNMTIGPFPPISAQQAHCKFYQEIHQRPLVRVLSKEKAPAITVIVFLNVSVSSQYKIFL